MCFFPGKKGWLYTNMCHCLVCSATSPTDMTPLGNRLFPLPCVGLCVQPFVDPYQHWSVAKGQPIYHLHNENEQTMKHVAFRSSAPEDTASLLSCKEYSLRPNILCMGRKSVPFYYQTLAFRKRTSYRLSMPD